MENETSQSYSSKGLDHPDIGKEIAFHEAGHFVFICMMIMHLKDFTPIKYVIICKEKFGELYGYANGISGGIPKLINSSASEMEFYLQDKKRMVGQIFSLMAGVVTYHEFIKTTDHFVGLLNYKEQRLDYYTFQEGFSKLDLSDFKQVDELLEYVNYNSETSELPYEFLQGTIELMQNPAVRSAIDLVCQKLLQSPCKEIEGNELRSIIGTVKRLISEVPYMDTLVKYVKILEERK